MADAEANADTPQARHANFVATVGTFSGAAKENFEHHMQVIKLFLDEYGYDTYDKIVRALVSTFRGDARSQLLNTFGRFDNKDDLFKALTNHFGDRTTEQQRIQNFIGYNQNHAPMRKYIESFSRRLTDARVPDAQSAAVQPWVIGTFIKGITDDATRSHLNTSNVTTIEETFAEATRLSDSFVRPARPPRSDNPRHPRNDHHKPNDKADTTIKCYNCNKLGHISKDCRQPRRHTESRDVSAVSTEQSENCMGRD